MSPSRQIQKANSKPATSGHEREKRTPLLSHRGKKNTSTQRGKRNTAPKDIRGPAQLREGGKPGETSSQTPLTLPRTERRAACRRWRRWKKGTPASPREGESRGRA